MTFGAAGYALAEGEGEGLWFFNGLFTVKAGGPQTRDAFTLIEAYLPNDLQVPPHIHDREDEGFYVLEGELSIVCGDNTWTAGPGTFALLPRGIPHSFSVTGTGTAKMLQLSSPAQFERFAAEIGEPASEMVIPRPQEVDVAKLMSIAPKYGIEMLPPPA
jgi:mannose-6-phosphate isomerase-like protein (cupin superfamily)